MEIYRCAGEGRAKLNTVANRHKYVSKWAWLLQGSPAILYGAGEKYGIVMTPQGYLE